MLIIQTLFRSENMKRTTTITTTIKRTKKTITIIDYKYNELCNKKEERLTERERGGGVMAVYIMTGPILL